MVVIITSRKYRTGVEEDLPLTQGADVTNCELGIEERWGSVPTCTGKEREKRRELGNPPWG